MYSRFTVASVPSTDTRFDRDALQAGLMAGTVPTKGTVTVSYTHLDVYKRQQ